jgi:hypothetical protein
MRRYSGKICTWILALVVLYSPFVFASHPDMTVHNLTVTGICIGCVSTPVHNTAIALNFSGVPTDGTIRRVIVAYDTIIPANYVASGLAEDSASTSKVTTTGTKVFNIFLDDTTAEGTITYTAGQQVGVFSSNASFTILKKHCISVVAPATHDVTLSDISVTFSGIR